MTLRVLICSLTALVLTGCGDDSTSPPVVPEDTNVPSVAVSPATATVPAGSDAQFSATTANLASPDVTWSVDGGSANGTITPSGLYRAPSTVPTPPEVTLRATSAVDLSTSGSAVVTVVPGEGPPPELIAGLSVALRGSSDATVVVEEGFEAAMDAIFDVSKAQGGEAAVNTGTFTLSGETWLHQPTPVDRMVLQVPGVPAISITWSRFLFAEDIGSVDDLLRAHDVAGRIVVDGLVDIALASYNDTRCCGSGEFGYTYQGTFVLGGETWTVNEGSEGTSFFDTGSGSFEYRSDERVVADYTTATRAIHIDYRHDYESIFVDNLADDSQETIASSYTENGVTYTYVGASVGTPAFVRRLTFNGNPSELELWEATGGILRNGEVYGILAWEPQLDQSFTLVLRSPNGAEILAEF